MILDPESPDAATEFPECLIPNNVVFVPLLLLLPVRRGHRRGRECVLGRNWMEKLLLWLPGVGCCRCCSCGCVALLVTVHLLLFVAQVVVVAFVVVGCAGCADVL